VGNYDIKNDDRQMTREFMTLTALYLSTIINHIHTQETTGMALVAPTMNNAVYGLNNSEERETGSGFEVCLNLISSE
jgi:hypothetical protein